MWRELVRAIDPAHGVDCAAQGAGVSAARERWYETVGAGSPTSNGAPRVVVEVHSYDSLHRALRDRWNDRGYAIEHANEIIGLSARFLNKALGLNPERGITMTTVWSMLSGFGLKMLLVEDPDAIQRFESRIKRRNPDVVRLSETHYVMTHKKWAQIAKLGRSRRWEGKSKQERVAAARHAANACWGRTNGGGR
jgi:hypothetical protein